MNPLLIWRIATAVAALLGIGGVAYGRDQHQKRAKEQAANHARIQELESEVTRLCSERESLRGLLGDKNEQVRMLAARIDQLHAEADALRKAG